MPDSGRAERLARNEARFRELNAQLERGLDKLDLDPGERAAFVCECSQADCSQIVKLALDAYRAAHVDDRHFVIVPGHEIDEIERVLERHEDYAVIEKLDIGGVHEVVARGGG